MAISCRSLYIRFKNNNIGESAKEAGIVANSLLVRIYFAAYYKAVQIGSNDEKRVAKSKKRGEGNHFDC